MTMLNETHDPALQSWVSSAQAAGSDFPLQNLPFASFRRHGSQEAWRGGVAIGDQIVDLQALAASGSLSGDAQRAAQAASQEALNALMALGPQAWSALRLALSRGLRTGAAEQAQWQGFLLPQAQAEYKLPARIGDYTDFYTSIHHRQAVPPGQPLAAQLPVGAHWLPWPLVEHRGLGHTFQAPGGPDQGA